MYTSGVLGSYYINTNTLTPHFISRNYYFYSMIKSSITQGKILLAEPYMLDPNFRRAAILLCEHDNDAGGSLGFIFNKPLQTSIDELLPDFPEFNAEVYFGGPVQTDTVHYVHNVGSLLEDSIKVSKGVYWGGDFDKLKFLIESKLIKPSQIRFFVGYTGWSKNQLQGEMNVGTWVLADMHSNYLFKSKHFKLWREIMYNKGDIYTVIAGMPDEINWN